MFCVLYLCCLFFSNGKLDPWSRGGFLESVSETVVAIVIDEGAHHLDLRSSNPADPPSVIKARDQEKTLTHDWIKEYNLKRLKHTTLHLMIEDHFGKNPNFAFHSRTLFCWRFAVQFCFQTHLCIYLQLKIPVAASFWAQQ